MLERVPRIQAVYNRPKNEAHRRMIDAAIKVQTPIVERIRDELLSTGRFETFFRRNARDLQLPIFPERNFVDFAVNVGRAWSNTNSKEREKLGLHEAFYFSTGSSDYSFFGLKGSSTVRMGLVISNAVSKLKEVQKFELFKQFNEGRITREQLINKLTKRGLRLDEVQSHAHSVEYTGRIKGIPTRRQITNVAYELDDRIQKFNVPLTEIARRLTVGFNPAL